MAPNASDRFPRIWTKSSDSFRKRVTQMVSLTRCMQVTIRLSHRLRRTCRTTQTGHGNGSDPHGQSTYGRCKAPTEATSGDDVQQEYSQRINTELIGRRQRDRNRDRPQGNVRNDHQKYQKRFRTFIMIARPHRICMNQQYSIL